MKVGANAPPSLFSSPERKGKSSGKKEKKPPSPHVGPDAILQTIEPPWRDMIHSWVEFKWLLKEICRSEINIRKCLTMLCNLFDNNSETAATIIDQSIANNWAGLLELKRQSNILRG